jgi:vitamin B12 transporter
MRSIVASLVSCLVLAAVGEGAANAARLVGVVRTVDGRPVPQLALDLEGATGSVEVLTGSGGRFEVEDLPAGQYRLVPRSDRLEVRSGSELRIADGENRSELTVAPVAHEESLVVTALRDEALRSTVGASTSVLDAEQIYQRQAPALTALLQELPGLAVARAGGIGNQASVFVRGGESDFTRVLIDGVPVNQPGGGFDFGAALPLELDRVELVRGAASSLYGSDALAGVLQLVTRRAEAGAGPALRGEAEAGEQSWQRYLLGGSGTGERYDWSLGLQSLETDSEVPNRGWDGDAGALSAGAELSPGAQLRLTVRSNDGIAGTPGATRFGRPDLDAYFDRGDLAAGMTSVVLSGETEHEARVGWAQSRQLSVNPLDSGPYVPSDGELSAPFAFFDFPNEEGFQNDTERLTLGYRASRSVASGHLLSGGVDYERETGSIGDLRSSELLEPERTNVGYWVQDRMRLGDAVSLVIAGRLEDNESFGSEVVPRLSLAWQAGGGRVVRGSAGLGVKEPSLLESYGVSFFAQGNPDLEPERSRTYDLGVEQRFARGRGWLEVVLFHHSYEDQIAYELVDPATFQGSFVNLGESRGQGVETSLRLDPVSWLGVRAAYTWLDGEILESGDAFSPVFAVGSSLLRRPEHEGSLTVEGRARRFSAGASWVLVGSRADSDFLGIGLTENGSYNRVDLRARGTLTAGLGLFAALDNAFDEEYEEVLGFPAPGRTLRVGLDFRFGG